MADPTANPFTEVLAIRGRLAKARTKQTRPAELARRYAHDVGLLVDVVDELVRALQSAEVRRCRICGCTEDAACSPPCWWVEADLCSACQVVPVAEVVACSACQSKAGS